MSLFPYSFSRHLSDERSKDGLLKSDERSKSGLIKSDKRFKCGPLDLPFGIDDNPMVW
jgi:hypothetical protein